MPLIFLAYGLVFVWYLHHGKPQRDDARVRWIKPWYRQKEQPSYADMLGALRRELWLWRISRYPSLQAVRAKLAEVLPTWLFAA